MGQINAGLVLGIAGTLSGLLMAMLALAISGAPGWRELRSFALVAFAAASYCLFDLAQVVATSWRGLALGESFALASSFLYCLAWIRHLAISERRPLRPLERILIVMSAVLMVLAFVPGALVTPPMRTMTVAWLGVTYTLPTGTPLGVGGVIFLLLAILVTSFRGDRRWRDGWHARLPMLGATTLVLAGVSDTLAFSEVIAMPPLIEAATVVVVGAMGVAYARRFIADAGRLEALSTKLEHEVASRTDELLKAQVLAAQHERLAGLGRIAAGVAHEVNNPTMVIQQNLDRMRALLTANATLTPELTLRIDRSRVATQRIADIVRQLLETGRHPPVEAVHAFAVAPAIARAIIAATVTAPDLRATVSLPDALYVRAHPSLFEQVIVNLLVNAAHATKQASAGGRVHIDGVRDGARVRLRVIDNGPGIPDAVRDRLFEPFATTKPVGEGTGLGLAVSRSLMTRQGGSLDVGRSTSEGTEMVLELDGSDVADAVEMAPAEIAVVRPGRSDIRVLVIDDDTDLREMLVELLDVFFHADEAATVAQAIEMIASRPPYDVVICDLMMPNGGAETWLERCTKLDPRLDDRTVLLTGGPTTEGAKALVAARSDKVLFKPVDIDVLRPMIDRVSRRTTSHA